MKTIECIIKKIKNKNFLILILLVSVLFLMPIMHSLAGLEFKIKTNEGGNDGWYFISNNLTEQEKKEHNIKEGKTRNGKYKIDYSQGLMYLLGDEAKNLTPSSSDEAKKMHEKYGPPSFTQFDRLIDFRKKYNNDGTVTFHIHINKAAYDMGRHTICIYLPEYVEAEINKQNSMLLKHWKGRDYTNIEGYKITDTSIIKQRWFHRGFDNMKSDYQNFLEPLIKNFEQDNHNEVNNPCNDFWAWGFLPSTRDYNIKNDYGEERKIRSNIPHIAYNISSIFAKSSSQEQFEITAKIKDGFNQFGDVPFAIVVSENGNTKKSFGLAIGPFGDSGYTYISAPNTLYINSYTKGVQCRDRKRFEKEVRKASKETNLSDDFKEGKHTKARTGNIEEVLDKTSFNFELIDAISEKGKHLKTLAVFPDKSRQEGHFKNIYECPNVLKEIGKYPKEEYVKYTFNRNDGKFKDSNDEKKIVYLKKGANVTKEEIQKVISLDVEKEAGVFEGFFTTKNDLKSEKLEFPIKVYDCNENNENCIDEENNADCNKEKIYYANFKDKLKVFLHANTNNNKEYDGEFIKEITVSKEDFTKNLLLPKVEYICGKNNISSSDYKMDPMDKFSKENHTFVGWTLDRDTKVEFGTNLNQNFLDKDFAKFKDLYKNGSGDIKYDKFNYIPPAAKGLSFKDVGDFDAFCKENDKNVREIHLYAQYRPYYYVKVHPDFKKIVRKDADTNHKYGKYENFEATDKYKKHSLKITLLTRTAVTDYTSPTVAPNANYNPLVGLVDKDKYFKEWNPDTQNDLKWHVPGYDEMGRRRSYVSLIINDDTQKKAYDKFGLDFNEETWKKFNVTTYFKLSGKQKEDAPKNLHETKDNADPYGITLAKTQSVSFKTNETLDAFTSATQRQAVKNKNKNKELEGYNIYMAVSPDEIPKPQFNIIRDRDKKITLKWPDSLHVERDYLDIKKIKIKITKASTDNSNILKEDVKLKEVTLELLNTGNERVYEGEVDGKKIKAEVVSKNLEIDVGSDNLKEYSDCYVTVTYIKDENTQTSNIEHVIPTKISKPVDYIHQIKKDENTVAKIKFKVPDSLLDQVSTNSKYIAQKWNGNKWINVGEKVLKDTDKINNKFMGNEYEINLSSVSHNDKVRIVSFEKNTLTNGNFYTDEEKNKGYEQGFSIPNYSTRKKGILDPYSNNESDIPNIDEAPQENKEQKEYVTLDLLAPQGEVLNLDELFRRFVNAKGSLDEKPDGESILKIDTKEIKVNEFTKEDNKFIFESFNVYTWPLDKKMTLIVEDKFANKNVIDAKYEKTSPLDIKVLDVREGKNFIFIKADKKCKINIKIRDALSTSFKKTYEANLTKEKNYVKYTFDSYKLTKGDVVYIEAKDEQNKSYSNPIEIEIN